MGMFSDFILKEDVIPAINEIDIQPAVDRGLMAFWREIRMSFPNATAKDLMPGHANTFRDAATKVTKEWIETNAQQADKGAPVSFSSFNRNQNAIQNSQWNEYHP